MALIRRFRFRLAALLGCTVRELNDRLGADEFAQWQLFAHLRNDE